MISRSLYYTLIHNFRWMSPAALDLAEELLNYDPLQRITATQAIETPYFTQEAPSASRPTGCVYTRPVN